MVPLSLCVKSMNFPGGLDNFLTNVPMNFCNFTGQMCITCTTEVSHCSTRKRNFGDPEFCAKLGKNLPATEQCKNYENRIWNRNLWLFEISCFFRKHFLTSPYEYSNERDDDVIPSQFSIDFIYRYDKNLIFPVWKYKTCLITTHNNWVMFTLPQILIWGWFTSIAKNQKISKSSSYNTYAKLWGKVNHQLHSFEYS